MNDNHNNRILYPLTHPQKRIWYNDKIYHGTSVCNIGGTCRINGKVDFEKLGEAINLLVKNNEGLRLRFTEENGEALQYVSSYQKFSLDFVDFSGYADSEERMNQWENEVAAKPFHLLDEPVFYFALFQISENRSGYLVKFHHIIADGWSINVLTDYIAKMYEKLIKNENMEDCLEPSYLEYVASEEKYLSTNRFLRNKKFWTEKFETLPDTLLDADSDAIEGNRKAFELDEATSCKIKNFVGERKYSLNTFFVLLYLLYVHKTTAQDDIVIDTPVYGRLGKREKQMVGMFTSTMPFRYMLHDDVSVQEALAEVNKSLRDCYFNQQYPYDILVKDLELKKEGYDNLFHSCVNYYNTRLNLEIDGMSAEYEEFYNGNQTYSLQLIIKDWLNSDNLTLEFDYKVEDYNEEQIEDMYSRMLLLANRMIDQSEEKLASISLLSDAEQQSMLIDFNDTAAQYPKEKCIYQLFEEQVERTPDKTAVYCEGESFTYRELNARANQLARYLVQKGVGRETIVGFMVRHSIETVVGILAVLKAGGAYLPIDCDYPEERMQYLLQDSNTKIVLTNIDFPNGISFDGEVISLKKEELYTGEATNLKCVNAPNDLVYIIYTSGSTGKPKGTMIEHQSLVNYIWWAKKMYVKSDDEVFPLYSSIAFDLTVTSIFTPLVSGSEIMVYDDKKEEEYVLYRIMRENKATVIKLTPSHLSLLKDMDWKNSVVRRFIIGGEDLKINLARAITQCFHGEIELFNEYGPTETVVGCMIHLFQEEEDVRESVPIGIPADNVQLYILDNHLNPVPVDTVGELYISGDGVGRGYLNKPDMTKEKMIANPFVEDKRMYKSGDSARFLKNGKIEYVGRFDDQVKIRGHRIEMGEVEKAILSHPSIAEVVVIPMDGQKGEKYLCAYLVEQTEVLEQALRDFLLESLPDYMLPSYYIRVEQIPLTINGKVDKKKLPKPDLNQVDDVEYVPARNEIESALLEVVSTVLNVENIGVMHNFYRLGGDSIKAIQIASKLNDNGLKIKIKDILSNPVFSNMALYIEENKEEAGNQEVCEGNIAPTPITTWFWNQEFQKPEYYNQSVFLALKKEVPIHVWESIFKELIKHHDMLRANYNRETKELFYNNAHLEESITIPVHDVSNDSETEKQIKIQKVREELEESLDVENGILIKACVFQNTLDTQSLFITAHHLIVDGVSWRILLEDIYSMLKQVRNGEDIVLPKKTVSYQRWAELGTQEEIKETSHTEVVSSYPADFDEGNSTVESCETVKEVLSVEETQKLLCKANEAYRTKMEDLLVVSLVQTIKEHGTGKTVSMDIESHGRDEGEETVDISRTVGWFTQINRYRLDAGEEELSELIKSIKEQLRNQENRIDNCNCSNDQVRLNYLGDLSVDSSNDLFEIHYEDMGLDCAKENHMTALIDINAMILNNRLHLELAYSKHKFAKATMESFLRSLSRNLEQVIEHCCNMDNVQFTVSDFNTLDISQTDLDSLFE